MGACVRRRLAYASIALAVASSVHAAARSDPRSGRGGDVVIYAADIPAAARHGSWTTASDPASPGGVKLVTPYTIWLRLNASGNSRFNDSVWVQFSDATANGQQVFPMNTDTGLLVNLAT